jgi:hypothetical protein
MEQLSPLADRRCGHRGDRVGVDFQGPRKNGHPSEIHETADAVFYRHTFYPHPYAKRAKGWGTHTGFAVAL